jgi:peptide/nickel transport system substrate-binding protein/oligopeptide transport system substrate-binding protein
MEMSLMREYRQKSLLISSIHLLLVVCCLLVPASLFGDVPPKKQSAKQLIDSRELVVAMDLNEEPLSFDPHRSTTINNAQLFTGITEGLVTYNPMTMRPIPGHAESISASDDQMKWTIQIREEARFSNGDPITAKTYRDSWIYMLTPGNGGDLASQLDMIRGVKDFRRGTTTDPAQVGIRVKDTHTLEIEMETPSPYLLKVLSHHAFTPIHPANLRPGRDLRADTFVSSGPFRVAAASDSAILLEQNPYYWDRKSLQLNTIRIELRSTSMQLLSEFSEGLVHWSEAYLDIPLLIDQDVLQIYPEYSTSFFYFSADSGPYADPDIRRAMALLIPWDRVREVSASVYKTDSLIPQDYSYNGNSGISARDRLEAMKILRKKGYAGGSGLPTMEIAIYPNAKLEKMTDIITDIWSQELGITIIIDVVPFSYYIDKSDHPYAMAYLSWVGDYYDPMSFLNLWTSESSFNPGKYHNEAYDKIIEKALQEPDEQKRYDLLLEAEQLLLETAAVIPISHGISVNFIDTDQVAGWYPNLLNIHPFKYMRLSEPSSKDTTI